MNFRVLSEDEAEQYQESRDHIFISICSPHSEYIKLPKNENRKGSLFMNFHDLDHLPEADKVCLGVGKPYRLFTVVHAELVWSLVDEHKDVDTIICNCEAGISRSAGVIAGIKAGMGLDDSDIYREYLPNSLVYRTLLEHRQGKMVFQVDGKNIGKNERINKRFRKAVYVPGKVINRITEKRNEKEDQSSIYPG